MKEHCTYCNKALFRMYLKQGFYSYVEDTDHYQDSNNKRMCKACNDRLLRIGHELECPVCETPIFALNRDLFREQLIKRSDLKGIAPQPDPYQGAYIACKHCRHEINLME